jgi:DNA-binding NarL/FixJ family response regulator
VTLLEHQRQSEGNDHDALRAVYGDPHECAAVAPRRILGLIADGLSNAEIGQELYIGDTTVKTHVTHILQKLNLRDRTLRDGRRGRTLPGRPIVAGEAVDQL